MSLFYFVEQYHRIGATAHFLGELATFFISHISRRCTHESRHIEFLHIFTHIDANECIGRIEEIFSQSLGEQRFAHTGRTEEHKRTDRAVRVLQSHTIALYGSSYLVDGIVLTYYLILYFRIHIEQTHTFRLCYALHRHTGHHSHHFSHAVLIDGFATLAHLIFPIFLGFFETVDEFVFQVAIASGAFEVLGACSLVLIALRFANFCFQFF